MKHRDVLCLFKTNTFICHTSVSQQFAGHELCGSSTLVTHRLMITSVVGLVMSRIYSTKHPFTISGAVDGLVYK